MHWGFSETRLIKNKRRKRPGQRRMAWSAPTEIKETRRAEGDSMLTYRRAESEGH
jgi:hypothetical protein